MRSTGRPSVVCRRHTIARGGSSCHALRAVFSPAFPCVAGKGSHRRCGLWGVAPPYVVDIRSRRELRAVTVSRAFLSPVFPCVAGKGPHRRCGLRGVAPLYLVGIRWRRELWAFTLCSGVCSLVPHKLPWLQREFAQAAVSQLAFFQLHPTLAETLQRALFTAWEPSTWASYATGVRSYLDFCRAHAIMEPLPPTTEYLLAWACTLFEINGVAADTIRKYTQALKSACRMLDVSTCGFDSHQHRFMMRGMRKSCPLRRRAAPRLPVTIWLLAEFFTKLGASIQDSAVKAGLAIGVYGLLRGAEFLAKSHNRNPLHCADAVWHSDRVVLTLNNTKTDIYKKGVSVTLFKTGTATCPFTALKVVYDSALYKLPHSPLIQGADGSPLAYKQLQGAVKELAAQCGLPAASFASHSLRIGGATSLALLGVPAHIIKFLGRWKSAAYQGYTRISEEQLRLISAELGSQATVPGTPQWFGGRSPAAAGAWGVEDLAVLGAAVERPNGLAGLSWSS